MSGGLSVGRIRSIHRRVPPFAQSHGGGMRQAGCWSAGLYALEHHVSRLDEDHTHAKLLEATLNDHPDIAHVHQVETNIVIFTLPTPTSSEVVEAFSRMGIACFACTRQSEARDTPRHDQRRHRRSLPQDRQVASLTQASADCC